MDPICHDIPCSCGQIHPCDKSSLILRRNALDVLPGIVRDFDCDSVYLLCDDNTWKAAGWKVHDIFTSMGITVATQILHDPKPDEKSTGSALMHLDPSCQCICACGSGVLNDIGKILSHHTGKPYILIATAPSMDGFASSTASMDLDGVKVSLPARSADVVVADTEILLRAPVDMIRSGLGDMLAKYVSIAEWRIAGLLLGESYCPEIAAQVRKALEECTAAAPVLLTDTGTGDREAAVSSVMNGLMLAGVSMLRAGVSRPASGMEHYISHIWDMRAIAFGTPSSFHGIQCAVGTLMTLRGYQYLRQYMLAHTPAEILEKARICAENFSLDAWHRQLREKLGEGALAMISREQKERKYDLAGREERAAFLVAHWEDFEQILASLPTPAYLETQMKEWGLPTTAAQIGISPEDARFAFFAAKDIRDKYVLGRLLWDLGLLEDCWDAIAE